MKIYQTLLFPLRGSGSGIYVDKLAQFLAKKGHQVNVLCSDHDPLEKVDDREYPVETILFNNGENENYDLDFNFPTFTTHPLSRETTFGSLSSAQRQAYVRVFRERIQQGVALLKPDVIHVHHGWVMAPAVAELGVPYVISLHGTERLGFEKYAEYRKIVLPGLHGARLVLALTERDREQAIQTYGLDPQKVVVVKSGIDTGMFRPLQVNKGRLLKGYGIHEAQRPVVFFGGKLTAIKGVDVLLEAARIYSRSAGRPITLIAGDGDARASLEKQAHALELEGVYFLGYQSQRHMVKLYNVADVVVLPSREDWFPLVAMEALACGTPVVASDVGGLRQLVNQQTGRLVTPDDPSALAEEVVALLQVGFKEKARGSAARHIRQNFSWENTVGSIEGVYGDLTGLRRPVRSARRT